MRHSASASPPQTVGATALELSFKQSVFPKSTDAGWYHVSKLFSESFSERRMQTARLVFPTPAAALVVGHPSRRLGREFSGAGNRDEYGRIELLESCQDCLQCIPRMSALTCPNCGGKCKKCREASNTTSGCLLILIGIGIAILLSATIIAIPIGLLIAFLGLNLSGKCQGFWVCRKCKSKFPRKIGFFEFG